MIAPVYAVLSAVDPGAYAQANLFEPLSIRVREHEVLTMRTPGRDEDLALGFLLTEGAIRALYRHYREVMGL